MSNTNAKIFNLVNFSPIGFKEINYPTPFCTLCRGYLTEVCGDCMDRGFDKCTITNQDDAYYHTHCHALMNAAPRKK